MNIKRTLTILTSITSLIINLSVNLSANTTITSIDVNSPKYPWHCGSIKEQNKIIDNQIKTNTTNNTNSTNSTNTLLVKRLISVYTSDKNKINKLTKHIIKYSNKYNLDPLTLTAVLAKESSFNPNAKHTPVIVKIPLAKNWTKIGTKEVQAVGLGGVIYEIWKYELNKEKIYSRKSLYNLETNIKATALILSIYTHKRKQLKYTKSKEESALLRYYGVMRDNKGKPIKTYANAVYKIKLSSL